MNNLRMFLGCVSLCLASVSFAGTPLNINPNDFAVRRSVSSVMMEGVINPADFANPSDEVVRGVLGDAEKKAAVTAKECFGEACQVSEMKHVKAETKQNTKDDLLQKGFDAQKTASFWKAFNEETKAQTNIFDKISDRLATLHRLKDAPGTSDAQKSDYDSNIKMLQEAGSKALEARDAEADKRKESQDQPKKRTSDASGETDTSRYAGIANAQAENATSRSGSQRDSSQTGYAGAI